MPTHVHKEVTFRFAIVIVYVDDINLIETLAELEEIVFHLKSKFEMIDLGKTRYCLDLEIEHCSDGILVHQSNYTQNVLRRFNEDKAKPLSTSMVVQTLNAKRDPFCPKEDEEEILKPEVPYMLNICLTHILHILKWAMSLPLETPLYLGGLPSKC
ncbi:uncharacterized mitochondrial protein AtMg00810-like [Malus domestica]|uniref:uncharacterized mitochondrial protein AtMg00810-like n=1 Tax=Malus domestica TaxID=3750 RepID=UPI003975D460